MFPIYLIIFVICLFIIRQNQESATFDNNFNTMHRVIAETYFECVKSSTYNTTTNLVSTNNYQFEFLMQNQKNNFECVYTNKRVLFAINNLIEPYTKKCYPVDPHKNFNQFISDSVIKYNNK